MSTAKDLVASLLPEGLAALLERAGFRVRIERTNGAPVDEDDANTIRSLATLRRQGPPSRSRRHVELAMRVGSLAQKHEPGSAKIDRQPQPQKRAGVPTVVFTSWDKKTP